MRIVLIGDAPAGLAQGLAARLHVEHLRDPQLAGDAFVLEGRPRDLGEALALDEALRRRAADLDVVLWPVRAASTPDLEAVLVHYRGRVVEFDGGADAVDAALDALREALLAA